MGKHHSRYGILALLWAVLIAFSAGLHAAPRVESVSGEVMAVRGEQRFALQTGQSLENGTTLSSGSGASAVIRFDDGQVVVLASSSVFKLDNYRFTPGKPEENRSELELVRGAMRFISGVLGKQTPEAVKIKTQTATIGIRGTDFMLATGSLYISVGEGAVTLTNAAGTFTLPAGSLWELTSLNAAPVSITSSQLPTAAGSYFNSLQAIPVQGAPLPNQGIPGYEVTRGLHGALTLKEGALSTLTITPVGVVAAGVAAAVAISNGNGNGVQGSGGTSGSTGSVR